AGEKADRHLDQIETGAARPDHHLDAEKRALAMQLEGLQRLRAMELYVLEIVHVQPEQDPKHVIIGERDDRAYEIVGSGPNPIDRSHARNEGQQPGRYGPHADDDAKTIKQIEKYPQVGEIVGPVDRLPEQIFLTGQRHAALERVADVTIAIIAGN